jgi:uncharacterized membrane protein YwaF
MASFFDSMFGPLTLDKDYCYYFQYMSIFSFVLLVVLVFSFIIATFKMGKKDFAITLLSTIYSSVFMYIQNRLLYSMCLNNIRGGGKYNESLVTSFIL